MARNRYRSTDTIVRTSSGVEMRLGSDTPRQNLTIEQGMRQPSATHRPGADGMRELAAKSVTPQSGVTRCLCGVTPCAASFQGQPLRPAGREPSIGPGRTALPRHPCHRLHPHPTRRTGHPAQGVPQKHRVAPLEPLCRASRSSASRPKSRHIRPRILPRSPKKQRPRSACGPGPGGRPAGDQRLLPLNAASNCSRLRNRL